jgi:predicted Zn-dependent protease with MMP-like domain
MGQTFATITHMERLTPEQFRRIVQRVLHTLPPEFQPYLQHLIVDVEEEPSRKLLRQQGLTEEEIDDGETILGIFWPLDAHWSTGGVDPRDLPARIIIYQAPHEEAFPDRRELLLEIRKTVIHELAHHFGYSEEDLRRFEDTPDPFGDDSERFLE